MVEGTVGDRAIVREMLRIPALHPEVRDLAVDLVELDDLIHQLLGDEQDD